MKYYRVTAKCGHVGGIRKYILIDYYTSAPDGKTAAAQIREAGRVQHDKKDAIQEVREISREEYDRGVEQFQKDPYNRCRNVQEQKRCWDEIAPRVRTEVQEGYRDRPREMNPKRSLRYGYDSCRTAIRDQEAAFCA